MSKTIAAAYAEATTTLHVMNEQIIRCPAEFCELADRFENALDDALSRDPRTVADVLQQLTLAEIGLENVRDELAGGARAIVDRAISAVHGALRCLPDQVGAGALR